MQKLLALTLAASLVITPLRAEPVEAPKPQVCQGDMIAIGMLLGLSIWVMLDAYLDYVLRKAHEKEVDDLKAKLKAKGC